VNDVIIEPLENVWVLGTSASWAMFGILQLQWAIHGQSR
jgi:hypothetical protein